MRGQTSHVESGLLGGALHVAHVAEAVADVLQLPRRVPVRFVGPGAVWHHFDLPQQLPPAAEAELAGPVGGEPRIAALALVASTLLNLDEALTK